jgi:hypothetical protein
MAIAIEHHPNRPAMAHQCLYLLGIVALLNPQGGGGRLGSMRKPQRILGRFGIKFIRTIEASVGERIQ